MLECISLFLVIPSPCLEAGREVGLRKGNLRKKMFELSYVFLPQKSLPFNLILLMQRKVSAAAKIHIFLHLLGPHGDELPCGPAAAGL